MKKRGNKSQSGVITAILLIVIVIVAVIIAYNVIYGIIKKSTNSGTSSDKISTQLEIKKTYLYYSGGANISVYRGVGEGEISSLKFIFEDKSGNRKIVERKENISEVEQKDFSFSTEEIGINNSQISKVFVVPIYNDIIGNEFSENSDAYRKDINGNRELIIPNGTVSFFKFNSDLSDSLGINNGVCTNCPNSISDKNGNQNSAYDFNGFDNYVIISNSTSLNLNKDLTISLWLKANNDVSNYRTIISKETAGNCSYRLIIWRNNGILRFDFTYKGIWSFVMSNVRINDSMWHHVACVRDDTSKTLYLYIDGVLNYKQQVAYNSAVDIPSSNIFIGGSSYLNGTYPFNGSLDNIMIINRSLGADEILSIYNNQK